MMMTRFLSKRWMPERKPTESCRCWSWSTCVPMFRVCLVASVVVVAVVAAVVAVLVAGGCAFLLTFCYF